MRPLHIQPSRHARELGFLKKTGLTLALALGLTSPLLTLAAEDAAKPSPEMSAQMEADYTQAIEKRTADILTALELKDAPASKRVHDAIMNQYRALRDWQAANEEPLKALAKQAGEDAKAKTTQIMATRKVLHDKFLVQLAADLSPEQIDVIKDKLTYGKLKVTYDAYCEIVPGLTDEEKAHMQDLLKEARELAMDGGSANEKSAIFKKYKGKINTYLSSRGHNVGKAYKDWGATQKTNGAAKGGSTNAPASPAQN